MDDLRQYVISIAAAAIVCGVLTVLSEKTMAHPAIKILCSVFLTVTVLVPVARLDMESLLQNFSLEEYADGSATAVMGENLARETLEEIIKEKTEAYILDKAAAYSVTLEVKVILNEAEPPVPVAVELQGDISPYAKMQLEQMMERDLGISKENQRWNG